MGIELAIFLTSVSVSGIILVIVVISLGHKERMKKIRLRELELQENAYSEEFEDEVEGKLADLATRIEKLETIE